MNLVDKDLAVNKSHVKGMYDKRLGYVIFYDGEEKSRNIELIINKETATHFQGRVKSHTDISEFTTLCIKDWGEDFNYYVLRNREKELDLVK